MEDKEKQPEIRPKEIKAPVLTKDELQARKDDIDLMWQMRADRDQTHAELDGMTYLEYYDSNRKKDLSYLAPKKNKQDVRITSGLTREKDTTLLSTMLDMNFVPDITAFDKDDLIVAELGDNMSDHVKKSREIENWAKKRPIIYRELIAQGDVFVQEMYINEFREMPLDQIEWNPETDKIGEFSIKRRLQKLFSGCAVRMVNGKKIYLGSVRIEYIEDQDCYMVFNMLSRKQAFSRYAFWERWANVPTTVDTMGNDFDGITYKSWNLIMPRGDDQVGEAMLYKVKDNTFQIYLNGVPMLPYNYPLTAICPSGEGPVAQGKLEPISDFAYSKSQPSKTKIEQEVHDEVTMLMVEGMRQGRKPPMGSRGKKVYAPGIFMAGKITPDIQEGDLHSLLPTPGLTTADFSFYQLIKQAIEEKTINKSYEGAQPEGDPTATQIKQEKQQQMLKLGSALDGVVNLERRLTWLRLYNVLENWTKKQDPHMDSTREGIEGHYRNFSVNTTLEDGQKGVKMFRYSTDDFPSIGEQQREERELSKKHGQEVRIVYMNPEVLRAIKCFWFIIINPTPQSNDELTQILYVQNLRAAYELFGPDSINQEYAKQRFAILINEDYNKFFKKIDIMQMLQLGAEDPAVMNARGKGGDRTGMSGGMKSAAGARRQPLRAAIK